MIFHGDTNCDGSLDLVDVESFTERITLGCCSPICPPPPACGGGGGGGSPESVGATMKAGLSKESQATFADALLDFIAGLNIQEKIDYWTRVLAEFDKK